MYIRVTKMIGKETQATAKRAPEALLQHDGAVEGWIRSGLVPRPSAPNMWLAEDERTSVRLAHAAD